MRNAIITGQQIAAARAMAGITQRELAKAAGFGHKSVAYWERKGERRATDAWSTKDRIRQAFSRWHVTFVNDPAPGVRLMTAEERTAQQPSSIPERALVEPLKGETQVPAVGNDCPSETIADSNYARDGESLINSETLQLQARPPFEISAEQAAELHLEPFGSSSPAPPQNQSDPQAEASRSEPFDAQRGSQPLSFADQQPKTSQAEPSHPPLTTGGA